MPILALLLPLIAAALDQTGHIPTYPPQHHYESVKVKSYDLPTNTEIIYFVIPNEEV